MLILSCSNVATSGDSSQSLVAARELAARLPDAPPVELADLRAYRLESCTMCEGCATSGHCVSGDDSSRLIDLLRSHDSVIFIVPHYAGLPSKLVILMEKLEEQCYLSYCSKTTVPSRWKSAWVVGHGGMTEDYEKAYVEMLVTPLSRLLGSIGVKVLNPALPSPAVFGVKGYRGERDPGSVCPAKDDDLGRRAAVLESVAAAIRQGLPNG